MFERAMWRNNDVRADPSWHVTLTDEQRHDIVSVTKAAIESGIGLSSITPVAFPFETLREVFDECTRDLAQGRGFVMIHRFPVDLMTEQQVSIAYAGFGSHFGALVGQNSQGELLTHIRDDRIEQTGQIKRLYRTRDRQDFHSDAADIIGLLCMHAAKSGGESKIVSSTVVYDEMMRRRPDLVDELRASLHWDRQDDHKPGERPWFTLAPVFDLNGEPRIFYVGWYIRNAQRHADVPPLTARQLEAMELLESLTNDPALHLEMSFQPGDIQLLNNGRILHAREAYQDFEDPDKRRHLLRLWLAAHSFTSVESGLRSGIGQPQ